MNKSTKLYIFSIIFLSIIFGFNLYDNYLVSIPYKDFLFFFTILLLSNNISFLFYSDDITKNLHFPLLTPIIILYGPFWSAFFLGFATIKFKYRKEQGFIWYKFIFNRAMLFINGGLAGLAYFLLTQTFNYSYVGIPLFISVIVNSLSNISIMKLLFFFLGNPALNLENMIQAFKTSLMSFFLGLGIYYSYIHIGRHAVFFIVVLLYITIDFFYAQLEKYETERQLNKTEEKLKYSKLKNNFFRNLSHELKTPLNLIFSSLQMLDKTNDKPQNEKYLNLIEDNSYRLLRLINNLLDLNKMESDSFSAQLKNINIVYLLDEISDTVRPYIRQQNKNFNFTTDTDYLNVACDRNKIERAILNLLSNAIKFTDTGDNISIRLQHDENNISISIKDTGVGMKEKEKEIIFEDFGQIDETLSRNHEGTGLGLSIVKGIIDLHNGKIELESEPQKGSEFILKIPHKTVDTDYDYSSNKSQTKAIDQIKLELSDIKKGGM